MPAEDHPPVPATRNGRGRWLVLGVAIAIVLGAGWWVSNSPVFDMRTLSITGNHHLSGTEVARLSGLTSRSNVLWLAEGAVEARLEADPWILSATVSRQLPSEVRIAVRERVPAGVSEGSHPVLIAGDGTVLGPARGSRSLPVIPTASEGLTAGERVPISPELAAVAALPPGLLSEVTSITLDPEGSLVLLMRTGITVYYGAPTDVAAKAQALEAVLGWAASHHVRPGYVDVRAPAAPAIGPSGMVPPQPPLPLGATLHPR